MTCQRDPLLSGCVAVFSPWRVEGLQLPRTVPICGALCSLEQPQPALSRAWEAVLSQPTGTSPPSPFRGCRLRKCSATGCRPTFGWADLPLVGVEVVRWAPEGLRDDDDDDNVDGVVQPGGPPVTRTQVGALGSLELIWECLALVFERLGAVSASPPAFSSEAPVPGCGVSFLLVQGEGRALRLPGCGPACKQVLGLGAFVLPQLAACVV